MRSAWANLKDKEMNIEKKAILAVSFGTSYNDSRARTIEGIEDALRRTFPDFEVRRAFTSNFVIKKLKKRDGIEIDNVREALERAVSDGIETMIVQPTHLMKGIEFDELKRDLSPFEGSFKKCALADPLLCEESDFEAVARIIAAETKSFDDGETAIIFMGHGTTAPSNADYGRLQDELIKNGFINYYIGTVEASPSIEEVIIKIQDKGYKKAVLLPLMVVAGDHANKDMAGDQEDSWKSLLEREGYEVECVLSGLGQIEDIQSLYCAHARAAISKTVGLS